MSDLHPTTFNKEDVYKSLIAEKVKEIVSICNYNNIPLFFIAAVSDDGKTTNYVRNTISAFSASRSLTDDKIASLLCVADRGWSSWPNELPL